MSLGSKSDEDFSKIAKNLSFGRLLGTDSVHAKSSLTAISLLNILNGREFQIPTVTDNNKFA